MKHYHFYFFIVLLFFPKLGSSQDLVKIPDMPISLTGEFPDEIIERYNKVREYEFVTLKESSKDVYDFASTVYHLYITKDSANFYFDRMIQRSPRRVCRILISAEKNHNRRIENESITPETNWFLEDLSDKNADDVLQYCNDYMEARFGKQKPPKEPILSAVVSEIFELDQKYRLEKTTDWNLQDRLDSLNRVAVDSLYSLDNSLKHFTLDEINVFSFVLHHSKDCEWNIRWTEIFFEELKTNNIEGAQLLQEAIRRWFKKDKGRCYKNDPEGVLDFLDGLRQKYPKMSKNILTGLE